MSQYSNHLSIEGMCEWAGLTRSVYYYKFTGGKPGCAVSSTTMKRDGTVVSNQEVVSTIKNILSEEFATYGYEYTAAILKRQDYLINKKKVYRLMKEGNLLLNKKISTTGTRSFIRFRTIQASYPMEYLSMDIKYIWVEGEKRYYYLLSIEDIYSRKILQYVFKRSIRKHDVIKLLKRLRDQGSIKGVIIRNDNGPQFIANVVKNFLRLAEVKQEFSHPATPQDNAYIEAFHSIMQNDMVQRTEFESYYEAKTTIDRFIYHYNYIRPHRSNKMMTPEEKWRAGWALRSSDKPLNEGASLSRLMNTNIEKSENSSLSTGLDKIAKVKYLCLSDELKPGEQCDQLYHNQFEKTVRIIGG
jgi:putative transposase